MTTERDARGTGLPAIYDALMVRDLDAFIELRRSISGLFPNVHGIRLELWASYANGIDEGPLVRGSSTQR
jgi:hypothetical protein